jgi:hypothetical protein
MEQGSLEDHLYEARDSTERSNDSKKNPACFLDWPTRVKIALGTASGLAYLHEVSEWLWTFVGLCIRSLGSAFLSEQVFVLYAPGGLGGLMQ